LILITSLPIRIFVPVFPYILAGGESGSLGEEFNGSPGVEGFVIYVGRRVGSGRKKQGFSGSRWRDSKKPRKTEEQRKNREKPNAEI